MPENLQQSVQQNQKNQQAFEQSGEKKHPTVFIGLAFLGIFFRLAAMALTVYGVSNGSVAEANPVFHMVSPSEFVLLAFAVPIILYLVLWAVPMSSVLRIFFVSIVTMSAGVDFLHDAIMVQYHEGIIEFIIHLLFRS